MGQLAATLGGSLREPAISARLTLRDFQAAQGLTPDGFPTPEILTLLRQLSGA